jgi:hypothetical protein
MKWHRKTDKLPRDGQEVFVAEKNGGDISMASYSKGEGFLVHAPLEAWFAWRDIHFDDLDGLWMDGEKWNKGTNRRITHWASCESVVKSLPKGC